MRYAFVFLSCMVAILITGCAGTAEIKSSQVRSGEIKAQKKLLLATNLGHHIGSSAFSYISTELPNRLRGYGVESMVIAMTTPDALEQTDIRKEAKNYGSPYVLTLTRGSGVITEYGELVRLEVIATLADASNGRRLWGSMIQHARGGAVFTEDKRTGPLVDAIVSEIQKIGLIGSSSASSVTTELTTPHTATKTTELVEVRLKKIDELLEKRLITADEHRAKRKEILGDL